MEYGVATDDFSAPHHFNIDGYHLQLTCGACPEQYDVVKGGHRVGYLRLRHGSFTAEHPYFSGDIVYSSHPRGDGKFEPSEREQELRAAVSAIKERHRAR